MRYSRTPKNLSRHRYLELAHLCMQYHDMLAELKNSTHTVKSMNVSDMPGSHRNSNATMDLAIRRTLIESKVNAIEQSAIEADADIYQYILREVTDDCITFNYLQTVLNMPMSRPTYFDRRRKFFNILDKKI